jgi:hypothetical protein
MTPTELGSLSKLVTVTPVSDAKMSRKMLGGVQSDYITKEWGQQTHSRRIKIHVLLFKFDAVFRQDAKTVRYS